MLFLDSVHEYTHHQTNHNILYCSTCKRAFNNPLSLSRHECEHKHKDLQCPKCDHTFTFESQVKGTYVSHIIPTPASFVSTQTVTRPSSMKVTSQDTQRGTMVSTISALTVRTRTLIRGTMIPINSVTAGLPNISAKLAVRSLCSIPKKRRDIKDGKCPIKHSEWPTF